MNPQTVPSVTVAEVADVLPEATTLLDVREDDEWAAGHAPDALHIPLGELAARLGDLPEDNTLYVLCRSGGRSARATAFLNANGWDATNVEGGMHAWQAAGKPMVGETAGAEPTVI